MLRGCRSFYCWFALLNLKCSSVSLFFLSLFFSFVLYFLYLFYKEEQWITYVSRQNNGSLVIITLNVKHVPYIVHTLGSVLLSSRCMSQSYTYKWISSPYILLSLGEKHEFRSMVYNSKMTNIIQVFLSQQQITDSRDYFLTIIICLWVSLKRAQQCSFSQMFLLLI